MPKPKRMFVLIEIDTTQTAKEVAAQVRRLVEDAAGLSVQQVHVNVSKPLPPPPAAD